MYTSNKYDFFSVILLLTNHKAVYNLNIEQITAFFTITGLCHVSLQMQSSQLFS